MLKLKTEVGIVEPDGSGTPAPYRVSGERRCRTGLAGHLRQSTQEPGLVMLFRAGPQGYPPLRSPRDGAQSGEYRFKLQVKTLLFVLAMFCPKSPVRNS
jgi:hypothetical protein